MSEKGAESVQITINVEMREEDDHGDHVKDHEDIHPLRILTVPPINQLNVQRILDEVHNVHVHDDQKLD